MIFNIWYRYRCPNIFPILGLIFSITVLQRIRGAGESLSSNVSHRDSGVDTLLWRIDYIKYKFYFVLTVDICQMATEVMYYQND